MAPGAFQMPTSEDVSQGHELQGFVGNGDFRATGLGPANPDVLFDMFGAINLTLSEAILGRLFYFSRLKNRADFLLATNG